MPRVVTQLLDQASSGDDPAVAVLMPLVYDELRALAANYLRREQVGLTLTATALVNEAYLKLVAQRDANWKGRAHFFAVAAQAIRRILVDHCRTRRRAKRGGGLRRVTLHDSVAWDGQRDFEILELNDLLERLAELDARHARVVELRFFGGMTDREAAAVLGVSERTIRNDWRMARAWLLEQLQANAAGSG